MGASKGTGSITNQHNNKIGLLANGSSGPWEIAIDETISGKDRWFAQLEGPSIYVYFEISSPRIIDDVIAYLRDGNGRAPSQPTSRNGKLKVGGDKHVTVSLVRDDEFSDRVFLVIGSNSSPIVRYTIAGTDINKIVEALRQVKEDLES